MKSKLSFQVVYLALLFVLTSCSDSNHQKSGNYTNIPDVDAVVNYWKTQGWDYHELLGEPGEFVSTFEASSEGALSFGTAWVEGAEVKKKLFDQKEFSYRFLRFQKGNDDSFVVVMRRRK